MNTPTRYSPENAVELSCVRQEDPRYGWRIARPLGWGGLALWHRLRCAWLVFTGRADVLDWSLPPSGRRVR